MLKEISDVVKFNQLSVEKQFRFVLENCPQWRSFQSPDGAVIIRPKMGEIQILWRERGQIYGDFLKGIATRFNQSLLTHINSCEGRWEKQLVVGYISTRNEGCAAIVMR